MKNVKIPISITTLDLWQLHIVSGLRNLTGALENVTYVSDFISALNFLVP